MRPLPAGYRALFGRLLRAGRADDRIRAMWLSGSLGRGVADAGSDLDVVLAVAADSFDEFAASWRDWLGRVTPTVLARELPGMPGSWYSLTPSCLRLDVVTERAGAAHPTAPGRRLLVLDKDGAAAHSTAQPDGAGPDPGRLLEITEEFLRQQAIFPAAVVARADWLLGVVGVQAVQQLLYELYVEANRPLPPMGVKQWSAKLTAEQRRILAGLPGPTASRDGVLPAMRAAATAFRRAATQILDHAGVPWPAQLDRAVLRYQESELGWTGARGSVAAGGEGPLRGGPGIRVAVFCGSSPIRRPDYAAAAAEVGRCLARAGIGLVYGGASVGLMGVLANAALDGGGEVIGVIPGSLFPAEVPHSGLSRLEVVGSMHERKARMAELADGFVALPGGLGTLDELFEVLTWRQLGLHAKPIVLLDVAGFWDRLEGLLDALAQDGLVPAGSVPGLLRADCPEELVRLLRAS